MSELFKIILTSSFTILGGILIFVASQIIAKFFIEPMHNQYTLIGEITDSVIFYANLVSNPGMGKIEKMDEASKILRQQASQLIARTYAIPWYRLWELLRIVRKRNDIISAAKNLIALSNSIHAGNPLVNFDRKAELEKFLNIMTSI